MNIKNEIALFTQSWNHQFFVETKYGNFIYSDPNYPNGNNTLTLYNGSFQDFLKEKKLLTVRTKGEFLIKEFCNPLVKVLYS